MPDNPVPPVVFPKPDVAHTSPPGGAGCERLSTLRWLPDEDSGHRRNGVHRDPPDASRARRATPGRRARQPAGAFLGELQARGAGMRTGSVADRDVVDEAARSAEVVIHVDAVDQGAGRPRGAEDPVDEKWDSDVPKVFRRCPRIAPLDNSALGMRCEQTRARRAVFFASFGGYRALSIPRAGHARPGMGLGVLARPGNGACRSGAQLRLSCQGG